MPIPVIVEAAWMIEGNLGPEAEAAFVETAPAALRLFDLDPADWARTGELVRTYADLALVDAAVIAVAERLGVSTIATVDHRDFRVVRPAHVDAFELIP
ncbi:MAG: PIN domain-containing protein [Acidimicrobiales bacterium]